MTKGLLVSRTKWAQWFRSNKMAVNTSKTKFIIFHTKGKKVNLNGKNLNFYNNDPLMIES